MELRLIFHIFQDVKFNLSTNTFNLTLYFGSFVRRDRIKLTNKLLYFWNLMDPKPR
jgi:hypothetical protein